MKKPNGRLLLTWNEKKHPEVVEFFDNIEEGLYSHSVRQAIKFYMQHKNSINENNPPVSSNKSFSGGLKNKDEHSSAIKKETLQSDEYVEFNPDDL